MKKMIFHHPLPLNSNPTSASQIRPIKMKEAFKKIGYDVFEISGYGREREQQINMIKQKILKGDKFDFLYSESSTQPTLLTQKNHLPIYPFLDFGFFKLCKSNNIKIGLFYRDIYWLFPEYGKNLSIFKKNIAKFFYKYDLKKYNQLVDILYLPSIKMAHYLPNIKKDNIKPLPPGLNECIDCSNEINANKINLLYIGGLGSHYQMHKLFLVLEEFPNFHFTLCTRKNEWDKNKDKYKLSKNISIVHKNNSEIKSLYKKANIAILFVKPQQYWDFAAPFKLYEYLGNQKPIIASRKTFAGDFVQNHNIGWTIEYNEESLRKLLLQLQEKPNLINEKKANIMQVSSKNTWMARALQVQQDLLS